MKSPAAEEVRNCFAFSFPDDNGSAKGPSRDLQILNEFSSQLRKQGFHLSEAEPAKPRGAVSTITFDQHSVNVLLVSAGIGGVIQCEVLTWSRKRIWRAVSPQVATEEWGQACAAIEKVLQLDLHVSSLSRLTEDELDSKVGS
jgi:hypothetical protein